MAFSGAAAEGNQNPSPVSLNQVEAELVIDDFEVDNDILHVNEEEDPAWSRLTAAERALVMDDGYQIEQDTLMVTETNSSYKPMGRSASRATKMNSHAATMPRQATQNGKADKPKVVSFFRKIFKGQ
mmetsp:Transcript_19569/g.33589  ORF Transcript_19569/g.33589 Transcript_19569/m.33589 type:complete len:127 (-) Transcript_19569:144-524(-)|eukprot:CAMPEP_0184708862 /NCGR_PEP_ID=MMETSP0313-20130426/37997_1 /TAXON_ID=2792 /ORGANISM="Porphyridium aerugineum, Strain SAG 1380-2" /LENGTH=126 /DNA_ID=CAMNT_0027170469 /DNA_START=918 /DNA_END=1298 /DNA_ORIENTATION=+